MAAAAGSAAASDHAAALADITSSLAAVHEARRGFTRAASETSAARDDVAAAAAAVGAIERLAARVLADEAGPVAPVASRRRADVAFLLSILESPDVATMLAEAHPPWRRRRAALVAAGLGELSRIEVAAGYRHTGLKLARAALTLQSSREGASVAAQAAALISLAAHQSGVGDHTAAAETAATAVAILDALLVERDDAAHVDEPAEPAEPASTAGAPLTAVERAIASRLLAAALFNAGAENEHLGRRPLALDHYLRVTDAVAVAQAAADAVAADGDGSGGAAAAVEAAVPAAVLARLGAESQRAAAALRKAMAAAPMHAARHSAAASHDAPSAAAAATATATAHRARPPTAGSRWSVGERPASRISAARPGSAAAGGAGAGDVTRRTAAPDRPRSPYRTNRSPSRPTSAAGASSAASSVGRGGLSLPVPPNTTTSARRFAPLYPGPTAFATSLRSFHVTQLVPSPPARTAPPRGDGRWRGGGRRLVEGAGDDTAVAGAMPGDGGGTTDEHAARASPLSPHTLTAYASPADRSSPARHPAATALPRHGAAAFPVDSSAATTESTMLRYGAGRVHHPRGGAEATRRRPLSAFTPGARPAAWRPLTAGAGGGGDVAARARAWYDALQREVPGGSFSATAYSPDPSRRFVTESSRLTGGRGPHGAFALSSWGAPSFLGRSPFEPLHTEAGTGSESERSLDGSDWAAVLAAWLAAKSAHDAAAPATPPSSDSDLGIYDDIDTTPSPVAGTPSSRRPGSPAGAGGSITPPIGASSRSPVLLDSSARRRPRPGLPHAAHGLTLPSHPLRDLTASYGAGSDGAAASSRRAYRPTPSSLRKPFVPDDGGGGVAAGGARGR